VLVQRRATPRIKFAGTHLYTWVERGTVSLKNTTQCPRALNIRPPRLPWCLYLAKTKTNEPDFRFSLGHKRSYDPDSDSVKTRNRPTMIDTIIFTARHFVKSRLDTQFSKRKQESLLSIFDAILLLQELLDISIIILFFRAFTVPRNKELYSVEESWFDLELYVLHSPKLECYPAV